MKNISNNLNIIGDVLFYLCMEGNIKNSIKSVTNNK